jgi:hypothetical protein
LQNGGVQTRVAIVAVVVVVAAFFALIVRPPIKEPGLSHELISMKREVESFEVNFFQSGGRVSFGAVSQVLQDQQRDAALVDQQNMDRLSVLLDQYGWPTKKQVGREGVQSALLVAQRAPDPAFKERVIALIEKAGDNDTPEYARLVDQVAVAKGEPQTYGTGWTCEDGRPRPATPVKDPERVLQRRESVGLGAYDRFSLEFCFREFDGSESGPATSIPPFLERTEP